MPHKHGYFVGAVGSEAAHFAHLDIAKPPILTYLDNPLMAVKAKKRYPNCAVIWRQNRQYRAYGGTTSDSDADLHNVYRNESGKTNGSDRFLDERERIMDAHGWERNVFIKLHNETGWSKAALDWQNKTTERALARGIPVAPGGWSVGTPEFHQIAEALPTLELASVHPDEVLYILNEYFAAVWMSGFTHDGITQPGDSLYFTRFIPRDQWPKTMDKVTAFHCGRVHQWIRYCHSKGLRVLFGIGEHGPDAVGGDDEGGKKIDAWRKGLIRTGSKEPRFYQGLEMQYRAWWPEWSVGEALAHQLIEGSSQVTYNHPDIVGYCYFNEGASSRDWYDANTESDRDFKRVIEAAASPQEQTTMPMPKPANAADKTLVTLLGAPEGSINVRNGAGELYRKLGEARNGEELYVWFTPPVSDRQGRRWYYAALLTGPVQGWVCEVKAGIFVPVVVPIPPAAVFDLARTIDQLRSALPGIERRIGEYGADIADLTARRVETANRLASVTAELAEVDARISDKSHARAELFNSKTLVEVTLTDLEKALEEVPVE